MVPGLYKKNQTSPLNKMLNNPIIPLSQAKSDATIVKRTPPKEVSMSNDEKTSRKLSLREEQIKFKYKSKSPLKEILKKNPILRKAD